MTGDQLKRAAMVDKANAPTPRSVEELRGRNHRRHVKVATATACVLGIVTTAAIGMVVVDGGRRSAPQVAIEAGGGSPATATPVHTFVFVTPTSVSFLARGQQILVADAGLHKVLSIGPAGEVRTFAGTGVAGSNGDGGHAVAAQLDTPRGLTVDRDRNVYIADSGANVVRRVGPDGLISTVAGNGTGGFSGDGGEAITAMLDQPRDTAVGPDGALYIADSANNRVRRVDPAGSISTYAGNGGNGDAGDGSALGTSIGSPSCVAFDKNGFLFICLSNTKELRKLGPDHRFVAEFMSVNAVDAATDRSGTIVVANYGDYSIDRVDSDRLDVITRFQRPRLFRPEAVAVEPDGEIIAVDSGRSAGASRPTLIRIDHTGAVSEIATNGR